MSAEDRLLRELFAAAVAAVEPSRLVTAHLPDLPLGRVLVIGAGKASAAMARGVVEAWRERRGPDRLSGFVVSPHGATAPHAPFEYLTAGHPTPDRFSEAAGRRALTEAAGLGPEDMLLALISGGASALLAAPAAGLTLEDKQLATRALLRSGAPITVINAVRKRLSAVKGGRLALAAAPARVLTLIVSDVAGDDPTVVGSGPTLADDWSNGQVLEALAPFQTHLPAAVIARLNDPRSETLKMGDARFRNALVQVVGRGADALAAAAELGGRRGCRVVSLGDRIEGEARAVAGEHAALLRRLKADVNDTPLLVLSGGETTVTVRGGGRGGRNSEYLLALALALDGEPGVRVLAADTDGVDGVGPQAGAMIGPETLLHARALGLRPEASLDDNNSGAFFERLGDLVTTGPTGTNVNDFRAALITPT